ncbi:universal stress protein [Pusillimonas caeni]|uniref:universal stress protein n=1 Tax=Pusillimonas caeni TaxID=1348472 RepID=UPI000E59A97F|nr:universal stress protein [Pusillimonas caeni]TFL15617.1 universal stress protein [Pusillimonas caeni]
MTNVVACIDGAAYTESVCDYGVWAAQRLSAPLEFVHVIARDAGAKLDASGSIGLGAQETLLEELAQLDQRRSTLAREHGQQILEGARQRAISAGVGEVQTRQRLGELMEALTDMEEDTRLYVLGQHEYSKRPKRFLLDHNLESAVRGLRRPILVAAAHFTLPRRFMIAFDGSATGLRMVELVAGSPLMKGLQCAIVTVGGEKDALLWATERLARAGFEVDAHTVEGDPADALIAFARQNTMQMIVMGAYGHSRIRQLVVGSTTTAILRQATLPVLILR